MRITKLSITILLLVAFVALNLYGKWYEESLKNGLYLLMFFLLVIWGLLSRVSDLISVPGPKLWDGFFLLPLLGLLVLDFYIHASVNETFGEGFVRFVAVGVLGFGVSACAWRLKTEVTE